MNFSGVILSRLRRVDACRHNALSISLRPAKSADFTCVFGGVCDKKSCRKDAFCDYVLRKMALKWHFVGTFQVNSAQVCVSHHLLHATNHQPTFPCPRGRRFRFGQRGRERGLVSQVGLRGLDA